MIFSFDLLDDIFDWCVADAELMSLLDIDTTITDTDKLLTIENNKLRREYQTDGNIEPTDVPFISFYFMHAEKNKNNWLVNVGDLYVDIYTDTMYKAGQISKAFRRVIKTHMESLLNYEGQHYSGVNGVYKYRLIYNPLVDGE